jgi:hypothetical protein
MGGDSHGLKFSPGGLIGWEHGIYEVRWYGTTTRRRRYEIGRPKYLLEPPDWANSSPLASAALMPNWPRHGRNRTAGPRHRRYKLPCSTRSLARPTPPERATALSAT